MTIVGYDPLFTTKEFPEGIRKVETKEELLRMADFISIHCPKTPETIDMIGDKEFQIMKRNAILINTARGGIIDESALIRALKTGKIGGAALDCFLTEPLSKNNPLMSIKERLIMTPHIGSMTDNALIRMGIEAVQNVLNFLDGKTLSPDVVVNQEVLSYLQ